MPKLGVSQPIRQVGSFRSHSEFRSRRSFSDDFAVKSCPFAITARLIANEPPQPLARDLATHVRFTFTGLTLQGKFLELCELRLSLSISSRSRALVMIAQSTQIVCHCLGIDRDSVEDAVDTIGCTSLKEVIRQTGAGSGCTACHCAIRDILAGGCPGVAQCPSGSSPICVMR